MLEAPPLSFVHTNARFGAGLHEERSSLGQVEAQQFTRQLQPPPEGGLKSQLLTTRAFAMHRQHHQESAETENKRLRELIYGPYKKAVQFQELLLSLRMTPAEYQLFKRIQQKHKALKLFEDKPPLLIKEEQAAEESTDSDGEDDYGVVTLKPPPAPVKPPTRPSTSGSISSSNDPLANLNPDTTNPHNNNGLDPNNKTAEGGSSSSNTAGGGSAQSMAGTSGETKSRPRTGMMQPAGVINTNSVDGEKGSADVAAAGDGVLHMNRGGKIKMRVKKFKPRVKSEAECQREREQSVLDSFNLAPATLKKFHMLWHAYKHLDLIGGFNEASPPSEVEKDPEPKAAEAGAPPAGPQPSPSKRGKEKEKDAKKEKEKEKEKEIEIEIEKGEKTGASWSWLPTPAVNKYP